MTSSKHSFSKKVGSESSSHDLVGDFKIISLTSRSVIISKLFKGFLLKGNQLTHVFGIGLNCHEYFQFFIKKKQKKTPQAVLLEAEAYIHQSDMQVLVFVIKKFILCNSILSFTCLYIFDLITKIQLFSTITQTCDFMF